MWIRCEHFLYNILPLFDYPIFPYILLRTAIACFISNIFAFFFKIIQSVEKEDVSKEGRIGLQSVDGGGGWSIEERCIQ